MRSEQELQDLLHEAAERSSPAGGAWQRFQGHRKRTVLRRSLVAVLAAALSITGALVVPRLFDDRDGVGPVIPGTSLSVHRDRIVKYQLEYPAGWVREGEIGGTVAFGPSHDALTGEGMKTAPVIFAVNVGLGQSFETETDRARTDLADARHVSATTDERSTTVDGKPARVFTIEYPVASEPTQCEDSGCRRRNVVIDWTPQRALVVDILAANQGVWSQYEHDAQAIVESIRSYAPATSLYVPQHGTFSVDAGEDALTDAALRFLDARTEGAGAEPWLSTRAAGQYDTSGSGQYTSGLRLYPADGYTWTFRINTRTERAEGQTLLEISIDEKPIEQRVAFQIQGTVERLSFAPRTEASGGEAAFVVMSATRAPACEAPPGGGCM